MRTKRSGILIIAVVFGFAATTLLAQTSTPDFSNYVSLGDSLTAGWESGCLVDRHQLKSYPAVLAAQFGSTVAQPGDLDTSKFQQPYAGEPGIPQPCYTAVLNPDMSLSVNQHTGEAGGNPESLLVQKPYNNLGIPGSEVADLINQTHSNGGDIYALVLRNIAGSPLDNTNAVTQAILEKPTFLTVWIGNNDVLGAATMATVINSSCTAVNNDSTGLCDGVTFTTVAKFTQYYTQILQTLRQALPATTIAVINIPDVTAIPFTTTIPPVAFNPATLKPILDSSGNTIPLIGQRHDGSVGPLPSDTLVTLGFGTAQSLYPGIGIPCAVFMAAGGPAHNCYGTMPNGQNNPAGLPLPDGSVNAQGQTAIPGVLLYSDEVAALQAQTAAFNSAVSTAAAAINAKVYDVHAVLNDVRLNGRTYGGVHVTTNFLSGGIFSYDGVHPSNAGYAFFADEFIKWLNTTYGVNVPEPNVYAALFEPDTVPAPPTPAITRGGALASGLTGLYPAPVWQSVLEAFPPVDRNLKVEPFWKEFSRQTAPVAVSGRR